MFRAFIIFVMQWSVLGLAVDKTATMEDLEALAKEENWSELLTEATLVRPASRTPRWKELVEKAAEDRLKNHADESHPSELARLYPSLLKAESFKKLAGDAAVGEFEKCTDGYAHTACTDRLVKFLEQLKPTSEVALKAGKAIGLRFNQSEGIRAYRLAIDEKNKALCSDESVKHSVLTALNIPKSDTLEWAKDIAGRFCFAEMRESVETAIDKDGTGYTATNGCAVLKGKNSLKGLRAKRCNQLLSKKS